MVNVAAPTAEAQVVATAEAGAVAQGMYLFIHNLMWLGNLVDDSPILLCSKSPRARRSASRSRSRSVSSRSRSASKGQSPPSYVLGSNV
jgi:hypothetical protein